MISSLKYRYRRLRTQQTNRITTLPIAVLMPHSSCNCRCVICDIWKDNKNLKQLAEEDIRSLLESFKRLGTKQVLLTGGEALMHPRLFQFCELLRSEGLHLTLLTAGLTLERHAAEINALINEVIVSIDGTEATHNKIRNIPDAFARLGRGVKALRNLNKEFPITARTVIHRLNFREWSNIVESARELEVDKISFLPADLSSTAFNRPQSWPEEKIFDLMPAVHELGLMRQSMEKLLGERAEDFRTHFIAETPGKIRAIFQYYLALHGMEEFPVHRCNAPWVSAVVEADGAVRPCFFHDPYGNMRDSSLMELINETGSVQFRKNLDMKENDICKKCVCSLYLPSHKMVSL